MVGIICKMIDSTGKPDFSVVYATRMEFLRTTAAESGLGINHPVVAMETAGESGFASC
jgi:hypothetical protein